MNSLILFSLGVLIQYSLVKISRHQKLFQPVFNLAPKTHSQKNKTPTMGGIGIILTIISGCALMGLWDTKIALGLFLILSFAGLGFLDDLLSIVQKKNKGLRATQKIILQLGMAIIYLLLFNAYVEPLSIGVFIFYTVIHNSP